MRATNWLAGMCLVGLAACCACSGGAGGDGGPSGTTGGSSGNGACPNPTTWSLVTLDDKPDAGSPLDDLAIAVAPGDVVGVAYLQDSLQVSDAGDDWYDVRYVQWAAGTAGQSQRIDQVHMDDVYGVSLAFQPSGTPAVAYLGGAPYGNNGPGASHYWYESAAIVATQVGTGWTQQTADDGVTDPNGPTTMGTQTNVTSTYQATGPSVVGLYSALGFDSKGVAYDFFRDVGFGECDVSPVGNCGASRIVGEVGDLGSLTMEWAFLGDTWSYQGAPVHGLGGHLQLVMANDQPALVTDEFGGSPGAAESGAQNVDFLLRLRPNNWSVPERILSVGDTQTGPGLAWDPNYGFAAVVYDDSATGQQLLFTSSPDGVSWSPPDDVHAGSGGWYPSVAIDRTTGDPSIADFFCSTQPGVTALANCPAAQRSLEVRERYGQSWCPEPVDPAGGYLPKIAFLSTGKRVIAYRQLDAAGKIGPLVLAVEQ